MMSRIRLVEEEFLKERKRRGFLILVGRYVWIGLVGVLGGIGLGTD